MNTKQPYNRSSQVVMDREIVIHPCKKFRSRIEAIVEARGEFIEQMCM
jgi:hypothetical protein